MLISYLELINELINSPIPQGLGSGFRIPGFQPYLDFLCNSVLLKFNSRAYKRPAEKVGKFNPDIK
jgi:nuclear pore complex protein Nup205